MLGATPTTTAEGSAAPGFSRAFRDPSLRAWQRRALEASAGWRSGPFLIAAAPGAGKTRPALVLARELLRRGDIDRVAIVCPTAPLTQQWAAAGAAAGLSLQRGPAADPAPVRPAADPRSRRRSLRRRRSRRRRHSDHARVVAGVLADLCGESPTIVLHQDHDAHGRLREFAGSRGRWIVVAHHVSMMGVQAGAARVVLGRDPVAATEALSAIEGSSRQAVLKLNQLLGFLRQEGESDELAPRPGLGEVRALAANASDSELTVEVRTEGEERPLQPTVDVSAFRIVQEALTNARKHSGASRADVWLRYRPDELARDRRRRPRWG